MDTIENRLLFDFKLTKNDVLLILEVLNVASEEPNFLAKNDIERLKKIFNPLTGWVREGVERY